MVDLLRSLIIGTHSGLVERLKWNAPSFALAGDDRITLGVERKGGVRVVLHRGAKQRDLAGFHFSDPAGLAKWPAMDRGAIVFKCLAQIESRRDELSELCSRWLTAPPDTRAGGSGRMHQASADSRFRRLRLPLP
jgi:hypothetical protein